MTSRVVAVLVTVPAVGVVFAMRGDASACSRCDRPDRPRLVRDLGTGSGTRPDALAQRWSIPKELLGKELVCPVSRTLFVVTEQTPATEHDGKWQYFCCECCLKKNEGAWKAGNAPEGTHRH